MRKEEWGRSPKVSGIECVGIVKACSDGEFAHAIRKPVSLDRLYLFGIAAVPQQPAEAAC